MPMLALVVSAEEENPIFVCQRRLNLYSTFVSTGQLGGQGGGSGK